MKKLLVIGGTGMTGKAVLHRAVREENVEITAFVRTASKLPQEVQDKIKVVVGDILNEEDVADVMKEQDVVISCLGKRVRDKGDMTVYTKGTQNMLEGIRKNNVKYFHFVGVSPFLAQEWKPPNIVFPMLAESEKMMKNLAKTTDVAWVATLAPNISDAAYTGTQKVEVDKLPGPWNVTKDDLADWLVTSTLDDATMEQYKHKLLGISSMSTRWCTIS